MRPVLALILLAALPGLASAQPADVSRVLRTFDFEERHLGNAEELPMHWLKVQGANLPHYVNGHLATDRARSGRYSFRYDLNGGGLIYRYPAGKIRIHVGAHYLVEGFITTTPLNHARARISAYLADRDGNPIPNTIRHSPLHAALEPDEGWRKLGVEISASDPRADSLVIELALLQPQHYAPQSLGQRTLLMQDIRGSAWFDDVTVSQVPRVTMTTDRPGNIFRRSDPLRLSVLVNDRFTDDLAAQLVIRDARGQVVYQRSGALEMGTAETIGDGEKRMPLVLPELPPGWYDAALVMTSQGHFVGQQSLALVRLADDAPPARPDERFGIIATDLPFDGWRDLPGILGYLNAGRVKLGVWSEAGDIKQADPAAFDLLLEELQEKRIVPTAVLVDLPPAVAEALRASAPSLGLLADEPSPPPLSSWPGILTAPREQWQPPLAEMIARHANHLKFWQIGDDGSDLFVNQGAMRQVYQQVYREFAQLVRLPDLAMPWPAWYEMSGQMPATVALHIKPEVLPSQVPLYVQDLVHKPGHHLSIYLEPLDPSLYGREVMIRDMAQRMAYALASGASRIDVRLPFQVQRRNEVLIKQPMELLLVIRTIMTTLAGATFKGQVPIAEGVEAFLFDRQGQGILMLWDRGNDAGVKQLALNLGSRPTRLDLWGHSTPLVDAGDGSVVQLELGPMPMFLLDIDGNLAQLRASIALDNDRVESSFRPHVRKLRFTNPYRQTISGSLKLRPPSGWIVNPPTMTFSLNPGETFERDLTLEFPYNSFAGHKAIQADFQVQADRDSTFTAPIVLKLGLSDVGLQTLALRDGQDVIVQQMITNYGESPIDYTAFALCPGKMREERLVTNLEPGRTTIKRYRFREVDFSGELRIRSGLRELVGTRILNEEVIVE